MRQDLHSDAILILTIQHLHSLDGLWNGPATPNEDAINIEGKGKVVSNLLLAAGERRDGVGERGC